MCHILLWDTLISKLFQNDVLSCSKLLKPFLKLRTCLHFFESFDPQYTLLMIDHVATIIKHEWENVFLEYNASHDNNSMYIVMGW